MHVFVAIFWDVSAARQQIHIALVQVAVNEFLEHVVRTRVFKEYTEYI